MIAARLRHVIAVSAGYLFGAAAYAYLPSEIPPAWRVAGHEIVWLGRPLIAFLLPTAAAVTLVLLRALSAREPSEHDQSPHGAMACDAIMFRLVLFLMGMHATVLLGLAGPLRGREWAARIIPALLGASMIAIGNLLPRTRPNRSLGIRTSRTLSDRRVWMRTHRMAGYMVVTLGVASLVGAVAPLIGGMRTR